MEDFSTYNGEGTTLRKAQLRMLDIMVEVDKICRKHNISYCLDCGTLLGAVRHGGFIPWDDDMDIIVLRKDYLKLRKILKKELPPNLLFQDETTDKRYPHKFGKVRDKNSRMQEAAWSEPKVKEQGLFVDIFPLERGSLPVKEFTERFYGKALRRVRRVLGGRRERIIAYMALPFIRIAIWLLRAFNFIFPAGEIIYSYGIGTIIKPRLYKSYFFPTKPVMFEGVELMGPANPHNVLTSDYGSYMQIPPVEKRRAHASKIEIYDV